MLLRILSSAVLAAWVSGAVWAQDIVVGQIINPRGEQAETCRDFSAGAQIYFDRVNADGGIGGSRISLLRRDEPESAKETLALAQALVNTDRAVALFGFCGGMAARVVSDSPWFKQNPVAMLAPLSGAEALRGPNAGEVYHVRASSNDEARKLAATLAGLGVQKVAIISTRDEAGSAGRIAIEQALKTVGLPSVVNLYISAQADEVNRVVKQVADSPAQAVIMSTSSLPAAMFVVELRKVRVGMMIMALSEVNHNTLTDFSGAKDGAQGVAIATLVPSPYFPVAAIAREHVKAMQKLREEPASHATLEGYIAAKVMVEALRRAGKAATPATVARALAQIGTLDLGGHLLNIVRGKSPTSYVDVAIIAKNGSLLN